MCWQSSPQPLPPTAHLPHQRVWRISSVRLVTSLLWTTMVSRDTRSRNTKPLLVARSAPGSRPHFCSFDQWQHFEASFFNIYKSHSQVMVPPEADDVIWVDAALHKLSLEMPWLQSGAIEACTEDNPAHQIPWEAAVKDREAQSGALDCPRLLICNIVLACMAVL